MALKDIAINIKATGVDSTAQGMRTVERSAESMGRRVNSATASSAAAISNMVKSVSGLVGGFTLGLVVQESLQAALAVEKINAAMKATYGNGEAAAREIKYVREEAARLGLVYTDAATAYAKFSASTKNTELEGEATRKIFSAVSEAVTAMKLSADESNGIFLALSQMMSKGKVSAEELTGQLGERLPGATKLAADALGMTTQELLKQMQQGKIMSSDLLPKLAEKLHETYGTVATEAAQGGQAQINRFKNEIVETAAAIGEKLLPKISQLAGALADMIKADREGTSGLSISKGVSDTVNYIARDIDQIKMLYGQYKTVLGEILQRSPLGMSEGGVRFWQGVSEQGSALTESSRRDYWMRNNPSATTASYDPQMARVEAERRANLEKATAQRAAAAKAAAAHAAAEEQAKKAAKEADQQYKTYSNTMDGFNRQIRDNNPYLTDLEKKLMDVDAAVQKAIEATPQYEKSLRAAGEAIKQNINLTNAMKESIAATSQEFQQLMSDWESEPPQHNDAGAKNLMWEDELSWLDSLQPTAEADRLNEQIRTLEKLLDAFPEKADAISAAMAKLKGDFATSSGLTNLIRENGELSDEIAVGNMPAYRQEEEYMERRYQRQMDQERDLLLQRKAGSEAWMQQLDRIMLLEKQHQQESAKLAAQRWGTTVSVAADSIGRVGELLMEGNRDQFEAGKAMMMGQAIMAAALAIIQCYTQLGPIGGTIAAVGVAAATLTQMSRIEATEYKPRAMGGPVDAGGYYLVGEQGPELIRMGSAGTVIPNHALAQAGEAQLKATRENTRAIARLSEGFNSITNSFDDLKLVVEMNNEDIYRISGMAIEKKDPSLMDRAFDGHFAPIKNVADLISSIFNGGYENAVKQMTQDLTKNILAATTLGFVGGWFDNNDIYGGKKKVTGSGITLGYSGGDVGAQQYITTRTSGGWFHSGKDSTIYSGIDAELISSFNDLASKIAGSINTAGAALGGLAVDLDSVTIAATKLDLRGMNEDEANKAIEQWFSNLADAMVAKLGGAEAQAQLDAATHFGETAYQTLMRVTIALQTLREAATTTGNDLLSTAQDVSISNGELASSVIETFGGVDKFTAAIDRYNKVVNSDSEYDALKVAAAHRQIADALADQKVAIPETVAEYRRLVEATDMTSPLYATLIGLADQFSVIGEAAKSAMDQMKDLQATLFDLKAGDSTLSPESRYNVLSTRFSSDAALALAGNSEAIDRLSSDARDYLDASKGYYGSGLGYQDDYSSVTNMLTRIMEGIGDKYDLNLPAYASGGYYSGGSALMGEEGPELVDSSPGYVYRADQTEQLFNLAAAGAGDGASNAEIAAILKNIEARLAKIEDHSASIDGHSAAAVKVNQAGFQRVAEAEDSQSRSLREMVSAARRAQAA